MICLLGRRQRSNLQTFRAVPPTVPLNKIYGKLRRRNFLVSSINHILASVSFGGVVFIAKRLVIHAVATSHGRLPLINCRHLKCTAHILGLSSNVIIFLCVLATRARNTRIRHIQLVMYAVATSHGRLSLTNCRHWKCTVIYWGCPLMSDVCLQWGQDTHVSDTSICCSSIFRQYRENWWCLQTSRLYWGNALLHGLPQTRCNVRVQNCAARLVCCTRTGADLGLLTQSVVIIIMSLYLQTGGWGMEGRRTHVSLYLQKG